MKIHALYIHFFIIIIIKLNINIFYNLIIESFYLFCR